MADPHVYPEPPGGALSLPAASGDPAPRLVAIEQLAGPDASTPDIPKTMFIRIAMSGADCANVNSDTAPSIYLQADSGDAVLINDPAQQPNQTYSIFHKPGGNPVDFVGEGSLFFEGRNVFRAVVAFADEAGQYRWRFGIRNNDAAAERQFTWVVSSTLAKTAQPWVDVAPADLSWDILVGESEVKTLLISNKGTGPLTVTGVTPALPSGFELTLPDAIGANGSAELAVRFGGRAPLPTGVVTATANVEVTPPDGSAGEGAGHNRQFGIRARVSSPDSWATKAPMPTGRSRVGLAAAGNGRLYAAGGASLGAPAFRTLEEYDPATDTWSTKAPMPTARTALRLVAAADGKIYAIGGSDANAAATEFPKFATVEAYDPATDTWSTRAPMLTARSDFGLAAASNGRLYAAGGDDVNLDHLTVLEEYDPASNRWVTKAPLPSPRAMSGLVAAASGKLYAFREFSVGEAAPSVDEYDIQSDRWTTKASAPTVRNHVQVVMAANRKVYVVGGEDRFMTLGMVEEYDPATNAWAAKAPMPTRRSSHALAAATNGRLYAVGGMFSDNDRVVEEYTPGR